MSQEQTTARRAESVRQGARLGFEHARNLATLNTASILLIAGFLRNIFPNTPEEGLYTFFPERRATEVRAVDKAHNEFLQVAATTGLLGLAAYLWIFVSYFRNAYRSGGWPLLALSGGCWPTYSSFRRPSPPSPPASPFGLYLGYQ